MTAPGNGKERVQIQLSAEELRILLTLILESIRDRNEITPETLLLGAVLVKLGRPLVRLTRVELPV
ncbi:hypothetical protein ES702_04778 [subsurface metagenome]